MCGIVGGWWSSPPNNVSGKIENALNILNKRGPDDKGNECYTIGDGLVILGHTRLSIIDLTQAGHQPMTSSDNRFILVFNGEIYNYRELRKDLIGLGHHFKSDSDTEVLLKAWIEWGALCLPRLEGMFAFVIYDQLNKTLTCVRDAFGIKPFFYENCENHFLFASEQTAILELKNDAPSANWQRCYDYLVHGDYDTDEDTFVSGVRHLLPGHLLEVNLLNPKEEIKKSCWWSPKIEKTSILSFSQATECVREQFLSNIKLHLRSDVPVGAALSGGIDSSAVVCAMRYVEPDLPLHTFSYIASDEKISEEKWVNEVNRFTGAIPHKINVTQENFENDLDCMIRAQGEPFGSTSIYAQFKVFQAAKEQGIKVTLDGQGADEMLAGYIGYPGHRLLSILENETLLKAHKFAREWSKWPGRRYKDAFMYFIGLLLPDAAYNISRKILGRSASPRWLNSDLMRSNGVDLIFKRCSLSESAKGRRVMECLRNSLQKNGLPSLLRHGDRNSMQFSVESRVPFLTIPLVDLLLSLPEEYLISNGGETKSVFRAAMRGIVPDVILDRKDKIGFETPEKKWILGMKDKIYHYLEESASIPFINKEELILNFESILSGKSSFTWQSWRWINFIRWYLIFGIK